MELDRETMEMKLDFWRPDFILDPIWRQPDPQAFTKKIKETGMLGQAFKQYLFEGGDSWDKKTLVVERQGIPKSGVVYFIFKNKDHKSNDRQMFFGFKEAKDLRFLASLLNAYAEIFEREKPIENVSENKDKKKLEKLKGLFENINKVLAE